MFLTCAFVLCASLVFPAPLLAQDPPTLALDPAVQQVSSPEKAAMVTMLVEIARSEGPASRTYVTFQLYKADDRWQVVNMADTKG